MPGRLEGSGIPPHVGVRGVIGDPVDVGLEENHHFRRKGQYGQAVDAAVGEEAPIGTSIENIECRTANVELPIYYLCLPASLSKSDTRHENARSFNRTYLYDPALGTISACTNAGGRFFHDA